MTKLAIVICTKDRPEDLERLFHSIVDQSRQADHIIVVDGSDDPIKHVVDKFSQLNIDYVTVRPPSLPKQRNVGINSLKNDTDWVGFLDDDLVLEKDSFEQILNSIENFKAEKPLGGISMMITNVPEAPYKWFRGLFFLDSKKDGYFTPSGCPGMLRKIENVIEVEWLSGGVTFWKKNALDTFSFDEWFDGTGYMEDVDFSYNVSQKFSLAYCGKSRCQHFQHPTPAKKMYALGVWQITAWWYFVRKFKVFSSLAALWSMTGLAFFNLIDGVFSPKGNRFNKFLGNLKGLCLVALGKASARRTWHK